MVNWDLQKEIWGHGFKALLKNHDDVRGRISGIVVSEPVRVLASFFVSFRFFPPTPRFSPASLIIVDLLQYLNLPSMRQEMKRMLREDMKFASVLALYPATMAMYFLTQGPGAAARRCMGTNRSLAMEAGAGIIIDIGFSYAHVVPFFDHHPIKGAIKRIDLGGKALTNYMKELVSFRSMNMMKETNLMEHIREKLCFVSEDVERDLKIAASKRDSPFKVEWFLPDGVTSKWGHIRDPAQPRGPKDPILVVNNERFMVPELLFNPGDIGMNEAGLAEATWEAVRGCHPNIQGLICANVSVIGGLAACEGLLERLKTELRPLVPDDYDLNIDLPQDPDTLAWRGGALIGAKRELFSQLLDSDVDG